MSPPGLLPVLRIRFALPSRLFIYSPLCLESRPLFAWQNPPLSLGVSLRSPRDFPGGPVVKTVCFHCKGARARSLVGELRSHRLRDTAPQKERSPREAFPGCPDVGSPSPSTPCFSRCHEFSSHLLHSMYAPRGQGLCLILPRQILCTQHGACHIKVNNKYSLT